MEPSRRGRALRMAVTELVLVMAGILLVRREIWQLHVLDVTMPHWQEGLLLPLSAIDGAITGAYSSRKRNVEHTPAYRGLLRWGIPSFVLLYVACSALCERLSVGVFPVVPELFRTLGFAVVLAGLGLRLWSQASTPSALLQQDEPERQAAQALSDVAATEVIEAAGERIVENPTEPAGASPSSEPAEQPSQPAEQSVQPAEQPSEPAEQPSEPAEQPSEQPSEPEKVSEGAEPPPEEQKIAAFVEKIAQTTSGTNIPNVLGPGNRPTEVDELFPKGPHKLLRYPDAAARLLALCGLPLCFNAWLPLLALPGIVVLLKWHVSDQEAFRISQLGERYLAYRKQTWNLIPYIY